VKEGRRKATFYIRRTTSTSADRISTAISKLAMANAVNTNMVFKWRRESRVGLYDDAPQAKSMLLPVVLSEVVATAATAQAAAPSTASDLIEVVLAVVALKGTDCLVRTSPITYSLRSFGRGQWNPSNRLTTG
jgi:transposase